MPCAWKKSASALSAMISAPQKALVTTPARRNMYGCRRPCTLPTRYTISIASRPPLKAPIGTSTAGSAPLPPSISIAAAPTAAPAETPSMWGSASGLRNSACSTVPAVAKAAPTTIASSARGRRMRNRMTRSTPDSARARARRMGSAPTRALISTAAARITPSTASTRQKRAGVRWESGIGDARRESCGPPHPGPLPAGEGTSSRTGQHRAHAARCAQVVHRLVDLRQRPPGGDQRVEIEALGAIEVEQARDVAQRVAAAERAADHLLLRQREQRRRREHHGVLDRRGADADGGAAVARRRDAGLDQAGATDGVEGVVDADAGELERHRGDVDLARVEDVGGAEALRHLAPRDHRIGGDDARRSRQARALDDA